MTPHRSRYAACLAAACLAAVALVPALASPAAADDPAPDSPLATRPSGPIVTVTFGEQRGSLAHVQVSGLAAKDVRATVLSRNNGKAYAVPSWSGAAMRLPPYHPLVWSPEDGATATPLAVLRLASTQSRGADALDPGVESFSWGADFSVDNDTGDDLPDGDNIFQRGLTPYTMWKLQVDNHRVTCGLNTTAMSTTLYTPAFSIPADQDETSLATRTWYRATCSRTRTASGHGWKLQAALSVRTRAGTWVPVAAPRTASGSAAGDLSMDRTIPLSVGGKLASSGRAINEHPDQFNGLIDNVRLTFE